MKDEQLDVSAPISLDAHRLASTSKKAPAASHDRVSIVTSNNAPASQSAPSQISFHRRELDLLLSVYGRKVAEGEWRDYAIDHLKDRAVFSVFRRTAEVPLYRIEKDPRLARRQGAYMVVSASGQILKRGHDLKAVLRVFDSKPKLSVV
ncbi:MAG: DUF2794 domain-containing protein [Pseudomonadota bacterium]